MRFNDSFLVFTSILFNKMGQDESVRLWNIHTGICILIFAGAGGHRNEVLSVVSHYHMKLRVISHPFLLCSFFFGWGWGVLKQIIIIIIIFMIIIIIGMFFPYMGLLAFEHSTFFALWLL